MDQQELLYWLAWNRVPGVGPARFFKLLEDFGSMEDAWNAPLDTLERVLGPKVFRQWKNIASQHEQLELEYLKAEAGGYRIYCYTDTDYPALLKKIPDPPPVLYCRGSFVYGDDAAIALVGTRNPSPMGSYHARELARELSAQGLTLVSGMARGIDSEAHWGALEAGGRTIAVLGSGIDVCYPPENEALMDRIAASGAVISEFALGTQPVPKNFPARNRIISGLSLGVVVVEATDDSGSLITAGFALEQGREVFAVPGSIENEGSRGPHKLIRQGAKLVESAKDILEDLAIPYLDLAAEEVGAGRMGQLDPVELQVYRCLTREPSHIDQIIRTTQLGVAQVNAILIQLEMKGFIKSFPGQLYLKLP